MTDKLVVNPLLFNDYLIKNGGHLPDHPGAHACWYYYTCAMAAWERAGRLRLEHQYILEGTLWKDVHWVQQKRSIAMLYGLESPDEMDKFWEHVLMQATELCLEWPPEELIRASPSYDPKRPT